MAQATNNITGDGNTTIDDTYDGLVNIALGGTFGSGTVTLEEYYADRAAWHSTNITWSSDATQTVTLAKSIQYRLAMSGSTTPDVDIQITAIGRSGY